MKILARASLRFYLRQPWQLVLCLLGIGLGVAVVVAMDIAIGSAKRGFTLSNSAVFGATTHILEAGPAGFSEAFYLRLRSRLPAIPSAPVVSGTVIYPRTPEPGLHLQLLGIDPFAEGGFSRYAEAVTSQGPRGDLLGRLLTQPGTVLATAATLRAMQLRKGDWAQIQIAGHLQRVHIIGTLEPRNRLQRLGLENVLIADIATAQELLGQIGRLSRIDLIFTDDEKGHRALAQLHALLPDGLRLRTRAARSQAVAQITRSFYLNLRMLSMLALVVGVFLVYNAMTFSVVQRREWLGYLRALGVSGRGIVTMIMTEALILGLAGTALGAPLGVGLAQLLLKLLLRTLDDLYFASQVQSVMLSAGSLPMLLLPGVCGALVAALPPALEAARISPRAATLRSGLEQRAARICSILAVLALGMMFVVPLLLLWWPRSLVAGYSALLLLVFGFACLTPFALRAFSLLLGHTLRTTRAYLYNIAVNGVRRGLSRNATAVIALMIALSASVGVGVMVDSFRLTLQSWLQLTLQADVYIAVQDSRLSDPIDSALARDIAAIEGIKSVTTSRDTVVVTDNGEVWLKALNVRAPQPFRGVSFPGKSSAQIWAQLAQKDTIVISESFAWHHRLGVNDTLQINTPAGARPFKIVAVFRDYGSERGMLIMDRASFVRHWQDHAITDIGLYLVPGQSAQAVIDRIQQIATGKQRLKTFSNRDIRTLSLQIFDRTFAVTQVLKWLAIVIAVAGMLGALAALQLEQQQQMSILRAQGLTRRELFFLQELQTGFLGLVAGLLAMPLGLALAWMLIHVINQRAFGWSMDFYPNPGIFIQSLLIALSSALLAGLYPAWKLTRPRPRYG